MEKTKRTRIVKAVRNVNLVLFAVLMLLILFTAGGSDYAYFRVNLFGAGLGIVDMAGFLYTLWLMFSNWMEAKYLPEEKRGFWSLDTVLILAVGGFVIFRILYRMNSF